MTAMGFGPTACGTPRKVRVIQEEAQAREAMYLYRTLYAGGTLGQDERGERERGCCLLSEELAGPKSLYLRRE
jgi:hypothetical protein